MRAAIALAMCAASLSTPMIKAELKVRWKSRPMK
jgi:hypothetical protein